MDAFVQTKRKVGNFAHKSLLVAIFSILMAATVWAGTETVPVSAFQFAESPPRSVEIVDSTVGFGDSERSTDQIASFLAEVEQLKKERPLSRDEVVIPEGADRHNILEPTSENRALLRSVLNEYFGSLNPSNDSHRVKSYDQLLAVIGDEWLSNKQPVELVASVIANERLENQKKGLVPGASELSSYASALLVPYLAEAGYCDGNLFGDEGLVCTIVDRAPTAPKVDGEVHTGDSPLKMREPRQGSELEAIFQLARQQGCLPSDELVQDNTPPALSWIPALLEGISGNAHAMVGAFDIDLGLNVPSDIEDCFRQIPVQAQTINVRLDSWEFGLLIFNETLNRVDFRAFTTKHGGFKKGVLLTAAKNAERWAKNQVATSVAKRSNAWADNRAKLECRGKSDEEYEDCYFESYENHVIYVEAATPALDMLVSYFHDSYLADLVVQDESYDATKVLIAAVIAWGTPLIRADIYGEAYIVTNVQYATPVNSSDQIFVLFPFGFTCEAHECTRIAECGIQYDDTLTCAANFADLKDFNIRPEGGYIEHSINQCLVSIQDYKSRPPYQAVRDSERREGSSGIEQDVTFRTAYQVPGAEHPNPNRCDPDQDTDAATSGDSDALVDDLEDRATDAANTRIEHLCPFATSEQGPTNPPTPYGAETDPDDLVAGSAQEEIPYWRWELSKVDTAKGNFSGIYAGLQSDCIPDTNNPGECLYNPETAALIPDCEKTRNFNGVESDEGHSFWAWHGRKNANPIADGQAAALTTAAAAATYYTEYMGEGSTQYENAIYYSLLASAAALGLAFETGKSYHCGDLPFSISDVCTDDAEDVRNYLSPGRNGIHPMPEVNIILAQKLNHDNMTCESPTQPQEDARIMGMGGSVAEGDPADLTTFDFLVLRRGNKDTTVMVDYTTIAGSADEGTDYSPVSGTLIFQEGEDSKTVSIVINGDLDIEPEENFFLELTEASNAVIEEGYFESRIIDNDGQAPLQRTVQPGVMIAPVVRAEGDEGAEPVVFRFERMGAESSGQIGIRVKTVDGTAKNNADYRGIGTQTVTIPAGSQYVDVPVEIIGDYLVEEDESFTLDAQIIQGDVSFFGTGLKQFQVTATLQNDDEAYTYEVSPGGGLEGNSGETDMQFIVTRSGSIDKAIPLYYRTYDGTAKAGSDYVATDGWQRIEIPANELSVAISVPILGDFSIEEDEEFNLWVVAYQSQNNDVWKFIAGTIVNDDVATPPTAQPDATTTEEDSPVTIDVLANDSDANQDQLTLVRVTQGQLGSATTSAGKVVYSPAPHANGSDTLTYIVRDSSGLESEGQISVTIVPVADSPVARDDVTTIPEDGTAVVDVLANDSDPDGETIVITEANGAQNGSVSFANGSIVYVPNPDYFGTERIGYTITDTSGESATAVLTVNVGSVNDVPAAVPDSATTDEDTFVVIDVLSNDIDNDGDLLYFLQIESPENGSVSTTSSREIRYLPASNFNGSDSFRYRVEDRRGGASDWATVAIVVNSINDAPIARNDSVATNEDSSVTIPVLANDSDGDGDILVIESTTQAGNGVVANVGANVVYTPNPNFHGTDTFTYTVNDGNGGASTARVYVTVRSINDNPLAAPDTGTTSEDVAITINVLANDVDLDGDALTISAVGQGGSGSVSIVSGRVRYVPNANFSGTDTFGYTIRDSGGAISTTSVAVVVNAENDRPNAVNDVASTSEDTPVSIAVTANDSDSDGDVLVVQSVGSNSNGTITNVGNTLVFTPNVNYSGTTSFTYTVRDPSGLTDTANVTVNVSGVNDAPIAVSDTASVAEDSSVYVYVLSNDLDLDGDSLRVSAVSVPQNGRVTRYSNRVHYRPDTNFNGTDTFTYTVSDNRGGTSTATVTMSVTAGNDTPRANNDSATTTEGQSVLIPVTANDTDPDGDALTISSVRQPNSGTAQIVGNQINYTPNALFAGTDSFSYTVRDPGGRVSSATVTVTVEAIPAVLTIEDITHNEKTYDYGDRAYFTITRAGGLSQRVTFDVDPAIGTTALIFMDYSMPVRKVTMEPGQSSYELPIVVVGDSNPEYAETVNIKLSNPSGATFAKDAASLLIIDDDMPYQQPDLKVLDAAMVEGNGATSSIVFTVARTGDNSRYVYFDFNTINGSANSSLDYYASSGRRSIRAGENRTTISVRLRNDVIPEDIETFSLRISNPSGDATISDASAIGTIYDDDAEVNTELAEQLIWQSTGSSGMSIRALGRVYNNTEWPTIRKAGTRLMMDHDMFYSFFTGEGHDDYRATSPTFHLGSNDIYLRLVAEVDTAVNAAKSIEQHAYACLSAYCVEMADPQVHTSATATRGQFMIESFIYPTHSVTHVYQKGLNKEAGKTYVYTGGTSAQFMFEVKHDLTRFNFAGPDAKVYVSNLRAYRMGLPLGL